MKLETKIKKYTIEDKVNNLTSEVESAKADYSILGGRQFIINRGGNKVKVKLHDLICSAKKLEKKVRSLIKENQDPQLLHRISNLSIKLNELNRVSDDEFYASNPSFVKRTALNISRFARRLRGVRLKEEFTQISNHIQNDFSLLRKNIESKMKTTFAELKTAQHNAQHKLNTTSTQVVSKLQTEFDEMVKSLEVIIGKDAVESMLQGLEEATNAKSIKKEEKKKIEEKNAKALEYISKEVLTTENSFLQILNRLTLPHEKLGEKSVTEFLYDKGAIQPEEYEIISTLIESANELRVLSEQYNSKLDNQEIDVSNRVAAAFSDPNTSLYAEAFSRYMILYDKNSSVISELISREEFTKAQDEAFQLTGTYLTFLDHLMAPIQRTPRYMLFLNDLKKHSNRKQSRQLDLAFLPISNALSRSGKTQRLSKKQVDRKLRIESINPRTILNDLECMSQLELSISDPLLKRQVKFSRKLEKALKLNDPKKFEKLADDFFSNTAKDMGLTRAEIRHYKSSLLNLHGGFFQFKSTTTRALSELSSFSMKIVEEACSLYRSEHGGQWLPPTPNLKMTKISSKECEGLRDYLNLSGKENYCRLLFELEALSKTEDPVLKRNSLNSIHSTYLKSGAPLEISLEVTGQDKDPFFNSVKMQIKSMLELEEQNIT